MAIPTRSEYFDAISSIEEIIEDARNGRMFILVDHEDRENEGDLVIPAQMCTPNAINFMATHGRGLICLAAPRRAARRAGAALDGGVELLAARDRLHRLHRGARGGDDRHLGARPRAHRGGGDRPALGAAGHRHARPRLSAPRPRRRRAGRAGHTEAAVDIARLAGSNASGVICEIMNEDGTMARLPDLVAIAQRQGFASAPSRSHRPPPPPRQPGARDGGADRGVGIRRRSWQMRVFTDTAGGGEHIVLSKGDGWPRRSRSWCGCTR